MNFVNLYYDYIVGETPEDIIKINKTKLFFDYLLDAGCSEHLILSNIQELPNKEYLDFNDIPNLFWDMSLIKQNKFYFHKELQIVSQPSSWDKSSPFYLEMKIRYTEEDIYYYFIKTFKLFNSLVNKDKSIGAIKFLLSEYDKYLVSTNNSMYCSSLDLLLYLIDYVSSLGIKIVDFFQLRDYEVECFELFIDDFKNAVLNKKDKVIWRTI